MHSGPRLNVMTSAAYGHVMKLSVCLLFPGPAGRTWTKGRCWWLWTERRKSRILRKYLCCSRFQISFWCSVKSHCVFNPGRPWRAWRTRKTWKRWPNGTSGKSMQGEPWQKTDTCMRGMFKCNKKQCLCHDRVSGAFLETMGTKESVVMM